LNDDREAALNDSTISTRCCIAGGGPAGMMLGFLLARAGVDVVVLEKHADFLRDFRGDTVHPSTLNLINELGFLDEFLQLPHQKAFELEGWFGDVHAKMADFSHLPPPCNYIALMPQWDFLNFLARKGAAFKTFRLLMKTEARSLIEDGGKIVGVSAEGPDGPLAIRADLTVAADGRHSTLRDAAGLKTIDLGAPMDVLWFGVPREESDGSGINGRFDAGTIFIQIDRGAYWQCGYVIAKGAIDALHVRGLDAFKADVARLTRLPIERLTAIASFDDLKLLSVVVDRLERWRRPGFLAIGDAAHAMSPIGGVGINLAVQDAVAAANRLAAPLLARQLSDEDLAAVERRRLFPARATQWAQVMAQNNIVARALGQTTPLRPPLPFRLIGRFAFLRRLMARLVGLGVRPEHVRTKQAAHL
jgi:2-polyprenyl-6-methoxyphenol hydroxylase-like FAD-dependent oxidoreductase